MQSEARLADVKAKWEHANQGNAISWETVNRGKILCNKSGRERRVMVRREIRGEEHETEKIAKNQNNRKFYSIFCLKRRKSIKNLSKFY